MKRALVLFAMFGLAAPAHADITHKLSSSVQLNVNSAATQATRIGSSYSVSGSGVDTTDGTTAGTVSAGSMTSNAAGVAGDLAGTITTAGAMTITGGGAGTQATGQFVTELTVR